MYWASKANEEKNQTLTLTSVILPYIVIYLSSLQYKTAVL